MCIGLQHFGWMDGCTTIKKFSSLRPVELKIGTPRNIGTLSCLIIPNTFTQFSFYCCHSLPVLKRLSCHIVTEGVKHGCILLLAPLQRHLDEIKETIIISSLSDLSKLYHETFTERRDMSHLQTNLLLSNPTF